MYLLKKRSYNLNEKNEINFKCNETTSKNCITNQ